MRYLLFEFKNFKVVNYLGGFSTLREVALYCETLEGAALMFDVDKARHSGSAMLVSQDSLKRKQS